MDIAKAKREIIGLALMVDEVTDLAVFVDYQAHVGVLDVSVRKSKQDWKERIFEGNFYCDFRFQKDHEHYKGIKKFLEKEIKNATEIA